MPNGGIPNQASVVEGVDASISEWVADERNRVLIQELPEEDGTSHADSVRGARVRGLDAWKRFEVYEPFVNTRWVLTWELVDV